MMLDSFLQYLQFEKRYSTHTYHSYETDIKQFLDFIAASEPVSGGSRISADASMKTVKAGIIRSWIVSLMSGEQKISPKSINRKISALKSYFKFLIRKGVVDKNPMLKIVSPKIPKQLPVYVEEKQMIQLFDYLGDGDNFPVMRNRMIIELLYCTGMRRSELIQLKTTDLDLSNNLIRVLGKGNKERQIPLNEPFLGTLKKYLELREDYFVKADIGNFVFLTDKGKLLYPKFVYNIVKHFLGHITTLKKRSPHVLRHTFATHLLSNGAPLESIKELLGHANLSATQIYTHNDIGKLQEIYRQSHPKA